MQKQRATYSFSWYFLLASIGLTPLANSSYFFSLSKPALTYHFALTPKLPVLVTLTILALLAWCLESVHAKEMRIRQPLYAGILGVFWLLAALSCLFAISPINAFFGTVGNQGLLAYTAYSALAFLLLQWIDSPKRLRTLAKVLVASGVVVALVSAVQSQIVAWGGAPALLGENEWNFLQGSGIMGNPNFTAAFLAVTTMLSFGFFLVSKQAKATLYYGAATVLTGSVVIIAQSRAAYVALVLGVVLLCCLVLRSKDNVSRRLLTIALVLLVVLGLGLAGTGDFSTLNRKVSGSSAKTLDAYSSSRLTLWSEAIKVIQRFPLGGTGPNLYQQGTYGVTTAISNAQTGARYYAEDPHNYPLMIAATLGLPALVVLLVLIGFSGKNVVHALKHGNFEHEFYFIYAVFGAAFLVALVVAFLGSASISLSLLLFSLLAALLAAKKTDNAIVPFSFSVIASFASVLLLLVGSVTSVCPLIADYQVQRFYETGAESALRAAINATPWDFWVQQTELIRARDLITRSGSSENAVSLGAQYDAAVANLCERYPHELGYYLFRDDALLYFTETTEDPEYARKGQEIVNTQLKIYPQLDDLKLIQSEFQFYAGQKEKAFQTLDTMQPSLRSSTLRMSYYLSEEDTTAARAIFAEMRGTYPPSPMLDSITKNLPEDVKN